MAGRPADLELLPQQTITSMTSQSRSNEGVISMAKEQRVETTTRAGEKVKVTYGKTNGGDTVAVVNNGRGYQTVYNSGRRK